jgi:hypothetical protein
MPSGRQYQRTNDAVTEIRDLKRKIRKLTSFKSEKRNELCVKASCAHLRITTLAQMERQLQSGKEVGQIAKQRNGPNPTHRNCPIFKERLNSINKIYLHMKNTGVSGSKV